MNDSADAGDTRIRLIIRADDFGVCHSINVATAKGLSEGVCTCAGAIVPGPWFPEAAQMCQEHPEWDIGVELAVTSEWQEMRWRPVSPLADVASLVDGDGFFHPTTQAFLAADPKIDEVEREVRAQIELAMRHGIRPSYFAHHMGALRQTPELLALTHRLAREYGAVNSRLTNENHVYPERGVPPESFTDGWVAAIREAKPGVNLLITHLGTDTPDLNALHSIGNGHCPAPARAASLAAATDPRVRAVIKEKRVELIGYATLRRSG